MSNFVSTTVHSSTVTSTSVADQLRQLANDAMSTVSQSVGYLSGVIPQAEGHGVNPATASSAIVQEVTGRVEWLETQLADCPILGLSVDFIHLLGAARKWLNAVAYYAAERVEQDRTITEFRRRVINNALAVLEEVNSPNVTDPFEVIKSMALALSGAPIDLEMLRTRYETDRTIAEIHQLQHEGDFLFGMEPHEGELTDEEMQSDADYALGIK